MLVAEIVVWIFRSEVIILAWLTMLGAVIGSFLNVVVYRLPAGKSLLYPGSQCPHCHHAIRWYDNLPVLGWFLLRGKCRDCLAPISPRYPAVEALTALVFLTVAITHVVLPLPDDLSDAERYWLVLRTELGRFFYLVTLLCCLEVTALMRYDGQRLPRSLVLFALLVGLVVPAIWPHVKGYDREHIGTALLWGAAVGLTAAMLAGLIVRWLDKSPGVAIEVGAVLVSVGIYLSGSSAGVVAFEATTIFLLAAMVSRRRLPWSVYAGAATWLAVALGIGL
ncbi:MAG: prepilin peptidase [Pirellulales bacterium]|nr:prepilin peptidase [Pirellulales bacterium]